MTSDEEAFETAKRASTLQVLFRVARRVNELALCRVRERTGLSLRPSHTALFPHLDLDGVRLTLLAARVGVSKQAVGQLVDELEAMGVVERRPDPSDGRARLVRFAGLDGLMAGLGVLGELERDLGALVTDDDLAAFRRVLLTLDDGLDRLEEDAGRHTQGRGA